MSEASSPLSPLVPGTMPVPVVSLKAEADPETKAIELVAAPVVLDWNVR